MSQAQLEVDGLTLIVKTGISRAVLFMVLATCATVAATLAVIVIMYSMDDILNQERTNASQIQALIATVSSTKKLAEQARDVASAAAAVEDTKPTIELRATPTSSPGKPAAVIVIKPPRVKALGAPSAGAAIEIPVKLPADATVSPR